MWLYVLYLFHTGNTVLFVAHASSLEACTRQIQGLIPQNSKDFVQVVRKVSVAFQFRRFFDFLCNFSLSQCFFLDNIHICVFFCPDSLLGILQLRRNGRDWGVAAGRPTDSASDTRAQSQFQLEGNANARLKDLLFGSLILNCWTKSGFHQKTSCKKQKEKTKKKRINEGKCIQTHCSGTGMYSLCGDYRKMCYSLGGTLLHYPQRYTC